MTATHIGRLPTTGKRYEVRDKSRSGLMVRVSAKGKKTWNYWTRIPATGQVYRANFGQVETLPSGNVNPTNVQEALEWVAKERRAVKGGVNRAQVKRKMMSAPSMEQLWVRYFKRHAQVKKKLSSQYLDEGIWRNHIKPEFGNMKVKSLDRAQVSDFHSRKLKDGKMANNVLALLSKMMAEAITYDYIEHNPCSGIKKVHGKHEWPILSDKQRNAILDEATNKGEDIGLIVEMALKTGARKQEILKATWENIKDDVWTVSETKSGRAHRVKLPPNLLSRLERWRTRGRVIRAVGCVFPSPVKSGVARQDIKRIWQNIRKNAGVPNLRFHDLRHDFGTQSAMNGLEPFDLMQAMGHSRIETTMRYINLAALEGRGKVTASREEAIDGSRALSGAK